MTALATDPPQHDPSVILEPLRRVRQIRQFTAETLTDAQVTAIVDVGRWSGSSRNSQPWRFIVLRDAAVLLRLATLGTPSTRALATATVAIAVAMPVDPDHAVSLAYDDGRASERMLIAASVLGLGAAIAWLPPRVRPIAGDMLGLPEDRVVRTLIALGHPAPEALAPRPPGTPARLPRSETVAHERWPPMHEHDRPPDPTY